MMEAVDYVQTGRESLFMEIVHLRNDLDKLYKQTGPGSSDYISLSIKLKLLIKEYFETQI